MTELTEVRTETRSDFLARPLAAAVILDWEKAIYLLFMVLALVTRLWGLGDRVMSHDESLHTQFSLQYFRGDGYSHTPLMHGPFLFHLTPLFYWLFGANDFSARLPVALFGVAIVGVFPFLLRPWLGKVGALFTSFFFLISPFITYYSRYIRHDIYVITWALIVFVAIWYYIRDRKEKYLWWFAGGAALMFSTKEVSFIYTAIFGSLLVIRLAARLWQTRWFNSSFPRLRRPMFVLFLAFVFIGAGFGGLRLTASAASETATTVTPEDEQGFAADPNEATPETTAVTETSTQRILHWLQVIGFVTLGAAVFIAARELRPQIDEFAEFDLIVLLSTLILPAVSPFLVVLAGWNPVDYSMNICELAGQADMTALQLFLARATNGTCIAAFLSSAIVRTAIFVIATLIVSALVGVWWNQRRWIIAAAIFHGIFLVLHTSVFTNPGGWGTGMVGALGYWLEQQEVQRGSQPWFYYLFIVPFYEFLPLIVSLFAIRLWAQRHRLNRIFAYWISLLLLTVLGYSFSNWLVNRPAAISGAEQSNLVALVIAGVILIAGIAYWFLVHSRRIKDAHGLGRSWRGLVELDSLVGFIPMVVWWLLLTWVAYSYAGEKMPWLSTHFVIPMSLLGGWYFNEKFLGFSRREITSRWSLLTILLTVIFIGVIFLTVKPLLLGQMSLGDQSRQNLLVIGSFLGTSVLGVVVYYLLRDAGQRLAPPLRRRAWLLGGFAVLSLLTMRFTYMSSWPNANYATEFMVYAHAGPAVKDVVMEQVETLSQRMHGDKSIRVAWGDDGTWPMQWYLRDYPNAVYVGKTPSANITEYPIVIAGHRDLSAFENFLSDRDYEKRDYIFLWWPMEEYRQIGWNSIFGVSNVRNAEGSTFNGRGIFSPDVRQALWDIFFYRDYTKYSETLGNVYTDDKWRLRAELRVYIRRDVLANLWDYGVGAAHIEPPVDPYAEGALQLTPSLVLGADGLNAGELLSPRNLTIGPDGNLYVLDSGNHRVVVFDQDGTLLRSWGGSGTAAGQFNEPWGIVTDDEFVYVADTWNHRVQKFTLEGQFVTAFGQSGTVAELGAESGGYFFGPRSLTLLENNQVLVTDTGNHRLQIFDRDGNFIRTVGSLGSAPGQLNEPVGLDSYGDWIYLADTWNSRIQRFTSSLTADLNWSIDGWEGDSTENKPYLGVDSQGRVYATDPENSRVLIFTGDGQYLARFGQPGTTIDALGLPNGIAIDEQDNVYIADARNNRILRFTASNFENLSPPVSEPDAQNEVEEQLPVENELPEESGEDAILDEPQPTPTPPEEQE